jgi:hypothetical protein
MDMCRYDLRFVLRNGPGEEIARIQAGSQDGAEEDEVRFAALSAARACAAAGSARGRHRRHEGGGDVTAQKAMAQGGPGGCVIDNILLPPIAGIRARKNRGHEGSESAPGGPFTGNKIRVSFWKRPAT